MVSVPFELFLLSSGSGHLGLSGEGLCIFPLQGWPLLSQLEQAKGFGVCTTKESSPVKDPATLCQEEFMQARWRDKPIHFVTLSLCTLSARWKTLTIFSGF